MDLREAFAQLHEKLSEWFEALVLLLPNFVVALLVLLVFAALAKVTRHLFLRLGARLQIERGVRELLGHLVQIAVLLVGVAVALSVLELQQATTSLLAGAGIVGLALGFAFQDLAANFISGIALSIRSRYPFRIGDLIETNDTFGIVERVDLRSTIIRTLSGEAVFIPNRTIFQERLINFTETPHRRVTLRCGISYGEDLEKVRSVALQALEDVAGREADRAVEFFFTGFGESSIDFEVHFWIRFLRQPDFLRARSEAVMRLKKAFDAQGIVIPFPIRTLDFGIKGGRTLDEVLAREKN